MVTLGSFLPILSDEDIFKYRRSLFNVTITPVSISAKGCRNRYRCGNNGVKKYVTLRKYCVKQELANTVPAPLEGAAIT